MRSAIIASARAPGGGLRLCAALALLACTVPVSAFPAAAQGNTSQGAAQRQDPASSFADLAAAKLPAVVTITATSGGQTAIGPGGRPGGPNSGSAPFLHAA